MSRQIEQALLSLIPTHGSDPPPTLVELASSLLAQSRHKASTLKADEEVARLYACANLACDRLKITLDLPPIDPRPPIPPRIYKRLYTHLDNILPNSTASGRPSRVRIPSSRAEAVTGSPTSQPRRLPSRATPTKEKSLAQFRSASKTDARRPTKAADRNGDAPSAPLHPWIRPVTRFICVESDQKHLSPTIMAGMEAIVTPGGRRTDDQWVNEHITSLLAATYFFVVMRVKAITSGAMVDREAYVPLRKEIIALLNTARKEVTLKEPDEEEPWAGWGTLKAKEFDLAVEQVNQRDWLTGEWYMAIADVVDQGQQNEAGNLDDEDDLEPQLRAQRADTMFQEKYNYLSEARRLDYAAWKGNVLSRIAQFGTANNDMEIEL